MDQSYPDTGRLGFPNPAPPPRSDRKPETERTFYGKKEKLALLLSLNVGIILVSVDASKDQMEGNHYIELTNYVNPHKVEWRAWRSKIKLSLR